MHEVEQRYQPLYPRIRNTIKENASARADHGIPIIRLPLAKEDLGMEPRKDQVGTTPEFLRKIHVEGCRLGSVDSIVLADGNNRVTSEIFSTFQPSPHTVYTAKYRDSKACWKEVMREYYPEVIFKNNASLVVYEKNKAPKHLPAQLITWVTIKIKTGEGPEDYVMAPVDTYQLAEAQQTKSLTIMTPNGVQKLAISNVALDAIYQSIEKHLKLHSRYLSTLYNRHIRTDINSRLEQLGISLAEKTIESIVHTEAIGYSRDEKAELGVGGGPQSSETKHYHTTLYPEIDEIRRLLIEGVVTDIRRDYDYQIISEDPEFDASIIYRIASIIMSEPEISMDQLIERLGQYGEVVKSMEYLHHFRGWAGENEIDLHAIKSALVEKAKGVAVAMQGLSGVFEKRPPVLGTLTFTDPKDFPPELLFKQVDPYSTIFFEIMEGWVMNELHDVFLPLGLSDEDMRSFRWHAEKGRFDMRVTEGWEITLHQQDFARVNAQLNIFMYKMDRLWKDARSAWKSWKVCKEDSQLTTLKETYGLSDEAIYTIKQIIPTDQQLANWTNDPDVTEVQSAKLIRKLEHRYDPKLRERAWQRIQHSPRLEERVASSGLFEVLGKKVEVCGTVYEDTVEHRKFNHGLNIPGDPGFGNAYELLDNGDIKLRIHPLLSEKALAEIKGFAVKRGKVK